jgi:hypothetical protein
MAIAREPAHRASKKERVLAHIAELKREIKARFPEAEFEVSTVPESNWPALWVRCDAQLIGDVTGPVEEMQWQFFVRERMNVHVLVLDSGNGS